MGFCGLRPRAANTPARGAIIGHSLIEPASLELHINNTAAHKNFALRGGRVARWGDRIASLEPIERHTSETERKHQAFALLTLLEMAYATANIFPVEVLPGSTERRGELHILRLAPSRICAAPTSARLWKSKRRPFVSRRCWKQMM